MKRQIKIMDGNMAAAHVAYAFTEVAAIYPITPSSPMADYTDKWAIEGRKNIFGNVVVLEEMQSESGAAGAFHGALMTGALATTYTASQGLLLMLPNMYKVAGELLPGVMHVSARTIASHALSIFGDHQDIYACRQTGFAMLASCSVQEVMDLSVVAHISAIDGRVPFLHFFDGFRTSHEIQKINIWDYETLKQLCNMDKVKEFRKRALNPERPILRGSAQNPDVFFQVREASNKYYSDIIGVVENNLERVNQLIGTDYKLFNYYGAADAKTVIIAMGSICETIEETVDILREKGEKVGVIKVRLYRPFSAKHLKEVLPKTVEVINVLDRTKEPGAVGEPLYLDVVAALKDSEFSNVKILNGRYGLSSKDTKPADIKAVFSNSDKKIFTIGIVDDVTGLSLEREEIEETPKKMSSCKFWGLGADGTVGANKNSIKIIGEHTDMYIQAYFDYDSKKSGGLTVSHLRFGENPIKSEYLIDKADFVACHSQSYIGKYPIIQDVKPGGKFLLNCDWQLEEVEKNLPTEFINYIINNNIEFYIINGVEIGKEIGLGGKINTVLQSAFFKLANIIPYDEAVNYMKEAAKTTYMKKGEDIVKMNYEAIDRGGNELIKLALSTENRIVDNKQKQNEDKCNKDYDFVKDIQEPINAFKGNELPVSTFIHIADGTLPQGTAATEKRRIALEVPYWNVDTCIQCNQCVYVCPHSVIRPAVLSKEENDNKPESMRTAKLTGMDDYYYTMTVAINDCTGCACCVNSCIGNKKNPTTLTMQPISTQMNEEENYLYGRRLPIKEAVIDKFRDTTVKGSQFLQPLLEFSGACAGCGETPYAKVVTQLFGDRMFIANATGCSSIWGGSMPSTPYTVNEEGKGPAWANSLFEDNAEFGLGMKLAYDSIRAGLKKKLEELNNQEEFAELQNIIDEYMKTYNDGKPNQKATNELINALENKNNKVCDDILEYKEYLSKKSQWIFGGDGWAYDIGYGGLDHVLASGKDVNVLVFDTEVYSNTGGQASKATPLGAIAQFADNGKGVAKKDLAAMAMTYGYVYVAQISQGANSAQMLKAFHEAESYNGPSLIIAYAPCINHGIRKGMSNMQLEEKLAVESGYWNLFRYDPRKKEKGENPFTLDSSNKPTIDYKEFLMGENRFINLAKKYPERAEELFERAEKNSLQKRDSLR